MTRDLIVAVKEQQEQGVAPQEGKHSLLELKSAPLAAVLESNRETLIRQNMVEDGKSREEAEKEVAGIFLLLKHLTQLKFEAETKADQSRVSIALKYEL